MNNRQAKQAVSEQTRHRAVRRVLVIGSGGAGKTTLARALGERLGLPVVHLDAHFWQPGWVARPTPAWEALVGELAQREAWVMDGNYTGTLGVRIAAADTVIFLDLPRRTCLWRVVRRRLRYHGRSRPDMAEGCRERLTWSFLAWIWSYPHTRRPRILAMLRAVEHEKSVVVLQSADEVRRFLERLPPSSASVDESRRSP